MKLAGSLVLTLTATILGMGAIVSNAPGDMAAKLVWTGVAFPLVWPCLVFWIYWSGRPLIPAGIIAATVVALVYPIIA